ncbi:MAG: hypothetical protein JO313_06235 [Verrucomicrobia bacterium]|nr:hypothetical protein [Verrucomicrobiota bacterium]
MQNKSNTLDTIDQTEVSDLDRSLVDTAEEINIDWPEFLAVADTIRRCPGADGTPSLRRAIDGLIRFLLTVVNRSKVGLDAPVSLAFTPAGPLVYRW